MKKSLIIILVVVALLAIVAVAIWYFVLGGAPYTPPEEPADERFGFLTGPLPDEYKWVRETGAAWVRPHPGNFIWGDMQKSQTSQIDFSDTDRNVNWAQKYDLNILPTIWHYAEWDQMSRPDPEECKVLGEEFSSEFGWHRCAPYNWEEYETWVKAVVERYDGDGTDDMPGLGQPVTHWEAFNEPDLPDMGDGSLQFFVGEPADYGELLKHTYQAVKSADREAKVLIAGAAGGYQFLDYYRELFKDEAIKDYFDITNVHCISNDNWQSFNVEPYLEMLAEFGINKPVWVTEAETFVTSDPAKNATQLKASTKKALELGAEVIFYTGHDFEHVPGGGGAAPPKHEPISITVDPDLDPQDAQGTYQKIFESM